MFLSTTADSPTKAGPLHNTLQNDGKIRRARSSSTNRSTNRLRTSVIFGILYGTSQKPAPNESIVVSLLCFEDSHTTIELLLRNICDPLEEATTISSLAALIEHHNISAHCLSKLVGSELSSSTKDGPHMCLRGDGPVVGLLSRYFALVGGKFLEKSIKKTVTRICERTELLEPANAADAPTSWMDFLSVANEPPEAMLSSDKRRKQEGRASLISGGSSLGGGTLRSTSVSAPRTVSAADLYTVHTLTTSFLESLQQAVDLLPGPLQEIMKSVEEASSRAPRKHHMRRDSHKLVAVASTVFLRFLTPAIVDPTQYDLVTHSAKQRSARNLLVFAKHIQSLISRTMDTEPSAYTKEQKQLVAICDSILTRSLPKWKPLQQSTSAYQQHSHTVFDYLKRNQTAICGAGGNNTSQAGHRLRTVIGHILEQDEAEANTDDDSAISSREHVPSDRMRSDSCLSEPNSLDASSFSFTPIRTLSSRTGSSLSVASSESPLTSTSEPQQSAALMLQSARIVSVSSRERLMSHSRTFSESNLINMQAPPSQHSQRPHKESS